MPNEDDKATCKMYATPVQPNESNSVDKCPGCNSAVGDIETDSDGWVTYRKKLYIEPTDVVRCTNPWHHKSGT